MPELKIIGLHKHWVQLQNWLLGRQSANQNKRPGSKRRLLCSTNFFEPGFALWVSLEGIVHQRSLVRLALQQHVAVRFGQVVGFLDTKTLGKIAALLL